MLDLLGRSATVTHEDVFIARYHALVLTALRITDGDRAEAEDLVHEAFMRFTLVQPPLDEVQHLDAYLSRMLRNMYTSRIRRRLRAAETSLSILDYDSLDIGFHAIDASRELEVRETLRAACEYGCVRKRSSKTGSVFLLRFFHGYLPSEIASVTRLSSGIIDALVFRARREVKGYVEHPEQLAFIGGAEATKTATPPQRSSRPVDGDLPHRGFMDELRTRIFNDTHERCWSKKTLREKYADRSAEALSRDDLADLVGCPICLDAVNALLGLPRLADRWPVDTLGPGSRNGPSTRPPGTGPRGGSAPATAAIAAGRRRTRAVFEHRPRELRISVNGFVLGSHTIGGDTNELTLSVNLSEPIALIELLSEQDLCLAFLDISPPPDGNGRQRRFVDLSDGRYAQIEVMFAHPWPTVRALYADPRPRLSAHTEDELAGEVAAPETQPRFDLSWRPRLFGSRPAWITAVLAVVIWLLFWTPGTTVSAAERIADTIKWLVSAIFTSESSSEKRDVEPITIARDVSLPAVTVVPPAPATGLTAGMSSTRRTNLELKALAELQHVDAYLGQEISFAAQNAVHVEVRALVDTAARKEALLRALGPLLRDNDLEARVTTVSEVTSRPRGAPRTPSQARTFAFTRDEFPMFDTVRRYLTPLIVDEAELEASTRGFAMQLLDRSRRASQHAWALKHLSERFPAEVIDASSPETREIWQAIVHEHARAYQQEIALVRRDLEPVARMLDAEIQAAPAHIDARATTWATIDRLLDTHRRQDQAIQDAFAIQSAAAETTGTEGAAPAVPSVQVSAFWTLIDLSETLATHLAGDPR